MVEGHRARVYSVAYSPDGRTVVSGSGDGTTRQWEVATGKELLRLQDKGNKIYCVAVAPNGNSVAAGTSDGSARIIDLAPQKWKAPKTKLSPAELNALWNELAGNDAPKAYRAVYTLSAAPMDVVAVVKERLQPVPKEKPERLQKLIAQLDDDDPAIRETATKQLAGIGAPAGVALRKAQAETKSAEVKLRVENLLKPLDEWVVKDPETLRAIRAIWVLQRIGTKEARAVLEKLAAGAPESRITQEAQSALTILSRKPPPAKK